MSRLVRMAQLLALTEAETEDCLSDMVSPPVMSPTSRATSTGVTVPIRT